MNHKMMNQFLAATNGGLDIFKFYISTDFELDEWIDSKESPNRRFKVLSHLPNLTVFN